MRIAVFGGSGFLGSHVADALTGQGYRVVIFDLYESPHLLPGQEMVVGDILDTALVEKVVQNSDVVYNLAGIADINECVNRPVDTVKYNILGNMILLEASRKAALKRFVFASSVYVYSNSGSLYRSSKQACETFIDNYHALYGLTYTIVRYGSLYGERADERNGIYRILKEALEDGKISHFGDGEEIREYIHVRDAAALSVEILQPEYENQHVILTGNQSMRFADLLDMIKEILNDKIEIHYEKKRDNTHYKITPYSFNPKLGRKLVRNPFIDMGQGLINCLAEIHDQLHGREQMGLLLQNDGEPGEQLE